jgi:hypothetical protein
VRWGSAADPVPCESVWISLSGVTPRAKALTYVVVAVLLGAAVIIAGLIGIVTDAQPPTLWYVLFSCGFMPLGSLIGAMITLRRRQGSNQ